jgi:hypothetical protein
MEISNNILIELQELSPVLASSYPLPVPYKVPEDYFGQLPSIILTTVNAGSYNAADELQTLSPLLSSISKKTPYHLPDDYFSDLSENTIAEAKALSFVQEELDEFSPVLHKLKHAPVYTVPAGYFDQLPNAILNKVQQHQPAKVVKMGNRSYLRRYIAAAAVVLVIAAGAFWFVQKPGSTVNPSDPIAIKQVPDEELIRFIDDLSSTAEVGTSIAYTEFDNTAMQDLLADVSDEELQQYVEKNSSIINSYN